MSYFTHNPFLAVQQLLFVLGLILYDLVLVSLALA
jgi:hypothetical protein